MIGAKLAIQNKLDKQEIDFFSDPFVSAIFIALCPERFPFFGGLLSAGLSKGGGKIQSGTLFS